jgi:hypothetical protein
MTGLILSGVICHWFRLVETGPVWSVSVWSVPVWSGLIWSVLPLVLSRLGLIGSVFFFKGSHIVKNTSCQACFSQLFYNITKDFWTIVCTIILFLFFNFFYIWFIFNWGLLSRVYPKAPIFHCKSNTPISHNMKTSRCSNFWTFTHSNSSSFKK